MIIDFELSCIFIYINCMYLFILFLNVFTNINFLKRNSQKYFNTIFRLFHISIEKKSIQKILFLRVILALF